MAPRDHELTGRGAQLTVGRAAPGVEIAIRDTNGTTLPPGERGEVRVRSPYVIKEMIVVGGAMSIRRSWSACC
ncbi:hypothetical protein [Streptomyces sp. NPDC050485]|uniref:hypothetical protein n=1 Tax=Streptomyces sp. NPDC050485 TaxID=3365617 RepID=UPI0037B08FB8